MVLEIGDSSGRKTNQADRLGLLIRGAVQGVGFRPFVFRQARALGLRGWVQNVAAGVRVEAEGPAAHLETFLRLLTDASPASRVFQSIQSRWSSPEGLAEFHIRPSENAGRKRVLVPPDLAVCPLCVRDLHDPGNRRYRYPFTHCTACGPRFTILESLPYDRERTSLKNFPMCRDCRAEYEDPDDRRFHAQANACPACGPSLEWWDASGRVLAARNEALIRAVRVLAEGAIVAVKGVGGFQLWVRADAEDRVRLLRRRKRREAKPFALMVPDLDWVRRLCRTEPLEEALLASPAAPIVLLRRSPVPDPETVADAVAPGHPYLGLMLPSAPLHHLLMRDLNRPVVATSGNLSEEPICFENLEARDRLAGVADFFLVHNRPILRPVDDSVVRVAAGRDMMVRRARGYAPLPITPWRETKWEGSEAPSFGAVSGPVLLAVGGQNKNTLALGDGEDVLVSPHVGDLDTPPAREAFRRAWNDLTGLHESGPECLVTDLHPDYASTVLARESGRPLIPIQHHVAHVFSCLADQGVSPPVLGVAWDGTGLGWDGTIWGGEFFRVTEEKIERLASFRPFPLPGGEAAVREPRRSALGLFYELDGAGKGPDPEGYLVRAFSAPEMGVLNRMMEKGVGCPRTSSVGRLFDAAASLLELRQIAGYEGQAALDVEFAAWGAGASTPYPIPFQEGVLDWGLMFETIREEKRAGLDVATIAARFHESLARSVVSVADRAGLKTVVLSGGCFQNRLLLERTVACLNEGGFQPVWHRRVPTHDGGLSLGQIAAALYFKRGLAF
jgi:hydrogenase maturation protein HypF